MQCSKNIFCRDFSLFSADFPKVQKELNSNFYGVSGGEVKNKLVNLTPRRDGCQKYAKRTAKRLILASIIIQKSYTYSMIKDTNFAKNLLHTWPINWRVSFWVCHRCCSQQQQQLKKPPKNRVFLIPLKFFFVKKKQDRKNQWDL